MDNVADRARTAWVFQANPQSYRLYDSLLDESLVIERWLVNRYQNLILKGHVALIWKAGQRSGIYAVGEIISGVQIVPAFEYSLKYWVDESEGRKPMPRVEVRYLKKFSLTTALLKVQLQKYPDAKNMEIMRQQRGTNFRVSETEWNIISGLLKEREGKTSL